MHISCKLVVFSVLFCEYDCALPELARRVPDNIANFRPHHTINVVPELL